MKWLSLAVVVSGQTTFTSSSDWSPYRTKDEQPTLNFGFTQTSSHISLAQTIGCNACTGSGCPSGYICQNDNLAYNPQTCTGTCITPANPSNYYTSTGYQDVQADPYRLFNAYHTPVSSYNTPPDWRRCTSNPDCYSCTNVNGCAWSGTYCDFSGSVTCVGSGCAFQARECPSSTPGTCAGSATCASCTSMPGCAWSGSTCYLSNGPCNNFGCANVISQCQNTGGVVPYPCPPNEVWATCVSSNCHEDNCQDIYGGGNRVCQNDCWSGCKCAAGGYARNGATCVPSNQCPSSYYGYSYSPYSSYASIYGGGSYNGYYSNSYYSSYGPYSNGYSYGR